MCAHVSENVCLDIYVCILSIIQLPEFQILHSRPLNTRTNRMSRKFSIQLFVIFNSRKITISERKQYKPVTGTRTSFVTVVKGLVCDSFRKSLFLAVFNESYTQRPAQNTFKYSWSLVRSWTILKIYVI